MNSLSLPSSRMIKTDARSDWLARNRAKSKKIAIFACILSITVRHSPSSNPHAEDDALS